MFANPKRETEEILVTNFGRITYSDIKFRFHHSIRNWKVPTST